MLQDNFSNTLSEIIGENYIPSINYSNDISKFENIVVGVFFNSEISKWELISQSLIIKNAHEEIIEFLNNVGVEKDFSSLLNFYNNSFQKNIFIQNFFNSKKIISKNDFREKAAELVKELPKNITTFAVSYADLDYKNITEGLLIGNFKYNFRKKYEKKLVYFPNDNSQKIDKKIEKGTIIAESVILTMFWVNTPANILTPQRFCIEASKLADSLNLNSEFLDFEQLNEANYGGIVGVGQGSENKPYFLILEDNKSNDFKKVSLVGKGITFDSGGISIKPAQGMEDMISDMAGAASVIAAMFASSRLNLNINLSSFTPFAENLPSASAQRPGDVITQYGGKTVEVLNTDAEGRLILADALVKASESNPDYIIDVATLTGAQIVALGNRTFGIMGDSNFRSEIYENSRNIGEDSWPMPFPKELLEGYKSDKADLTNLNNSRAGGMLSAGVFLNEFVPKTIKWAHLDIAGPALSTTSKGLINKGATGISVRTLIETLEKISDT